jgi:hypothetical protein
MSTADLIEFGFDHDGNYQRGIRRPDGWSLYATLDTRGFGWQLRDLHGWISRHMTKDEAIAALLRP